MRGVSASFRVLASVIGLLILAPVLGAAPARATVSTATCPALEVTTVRGMGEPAGNGWVLGPIAADVQQTLPIPVSVYPLPYAAGQDIIANTNQGISLLVSHLTQEATACPATKFAVLGFSLGAVVVGEAFAAVSTRYPGVTTTPIPSQLDSRLAAVVVFGDTRFNAAGPEAAGTFAPGVSAPYARPANAFARFGNHVRDVCNYQDGICQNLPGSQTTAAAHQDYVKYEDQVANYIYGEIQQMS